MRKVASLLLLFAGVVELISCLVLYVLPSGRVAYWTDYRLFGLSKTQWGNIHLTVGTLILIAVGIHIFYNWRPIISYLKISTPKVSFTRQHVVIALLLTLFVVIGTPLNLPPMSYIVSIGERITDQANQKYGEPPYGHAELSSLRMFSKKMRLDLVRATKLLEEKNIRVDDTTETLLHIAKTNNITPQEIYDIIKPASNEKEGKVSFPDSPFPGFGKKTLAEICTKYSLSLNAVLLKIDSGKNVIVSNDTVKNIANKLEITPMQVFERIKAIAEREVKE